MTPRPRPPPPPPSSSLPSLTSSALLHSFVKNDVQHSTSRLASEEDVPQLTLANVCKDIYDGVVGLLINPQAARIVYPLVICFSSLLAKIVIKTVPYTEIDYSTYIQQIKLIDQGEIDYAEVYGDSGPIVYPAGFYSVYSYIYWFIGDNIKEAQNIFGYVFTASVLLTTVIYAQIWDVPPWPIYLLLASKRLVSIYMLRMFNDCWTTLAILGTVVLLQQAAVYKSTHNEKISDNGTESLNSKLEKRTKANKRKQTQQTQQTQENEILTKLNGFDLSYMLTLAAADLYSMAISIKMNALLYLPAFLIIVYFLNDENLFKFISVVSIIPFIQLVMGWKFLLPLYNDEVARQIRWNYITQAFDFKRKFLYEWTVNWRFLLEQVFLSDYFSRFLLVAHSATLLLFIFTRFLNERITGKLFNQLVKDAFNHKSTITYSKNAFADKLIAPQLIFYIMAITNLIGVLFSRSLHYQFLAWYAWSFPALLLLNFPVYIGVPIWFVHEWCWNVFPSTKLSSILLVSILLVTIILSYINFKKWFPLSKTIAEYREWEAAQKERKDE